jgi:hypothetical protein
MNRQETCRILSCITAVYPSFLKDRDPKVLEEIWYGIFSRVPYEEVRDAMTAFFASDTKGFPPTPGVINAWIMEARNVHEMTEDEAWRLVARAASRGTYNSLEEFEKLPPEVQQIVCSPRQIYEWANMDCSEFNTVIAASFKRSWRVRQEKKKELGVFLPVFEEARRLRG